MQRNAGRFLLLTALSLSLALLPGTTALAQDPPPPGPIASLWVFWVKAGHAPAFETAIKAHAAWRKSAGEPFVWNAFQPVVGDDLTHYVYHSGGHHWKDLDAEQAWEMKAAARQKWEEQVAPHVERVVHHLSENDAKHSTWTASPDYTLFGVSALTLVPGTRSDMLAALSLVHKAAMAKGWSRSYAISWEIGGSGGMTVVEPFKSYADMADPDPSFMQVVADALGSKDAAAQAFKQIGSSFATQDYTIYALRPDISTPR